MLRMISLNAPRRARNAPDDFAKRAEGGRAMLRMISPNAPRRARNAPYDFAKRAEESAQ
jgi:hypothetical protein